MRKAFQQVAQRFSTAMGSPWVFLLAVLVTLAWIAWGPLAHYTDRWQLWANTVTNVVTFLMVFLIQSTQNRDSKAIHLKLDELIRSQRGARNRLVNLEDWSDEELNALQQEFDRVRVRSHVKEHLSTGRVPGEEQARR